MSTLLLIPWIIFGYKHPSYRFIGLCQTWKSMLILLGFEVLYWSVLLSLLGKTGASTAGEGSFAWKYILLYEKGIVPVWWLGRKIDPLLPDKIDANYKFLYLVATLTMDYIFLFILSPRVPQLFSRKKTQSMNEQA